MIHEVMVLDHSGPDLALIHYGAMLKLWVLGTLLVGILVPVRSGRWIVDLADGRRRPAGPGGAGRGDRIDDRPPATGARAAIPGRGLGAVDPCLGTRDEVKRESLARCGPGPADSHEPAPAGFQPARMRAFAPWPPRRCCWESFRCWSASGRHGPSAAAVDAGEHGDQGRRFALAAAAGRARGRRAKRSRADRGLYHFAAVGIGAAGRRRCTSAASCRRCPAPTARRFSCPWPSSR